MSKAPEVMSGIREYLAGMNHEWDFTKKIVGLLDQAKAEEFSDEVQLKILMLDSVENEQTMAMLDLLSGQLPDDVAQKPEFRSAIEWDNMLRQVSTSLSWEEKDAIDAIVRREMAAKENA